MSPQRPHKKTENQGHRGVPGDYDDDGIDDPTPSDRQKVPAEFLEPEPRKLCFLGRWFVFSLFVKLFCYCQTNTCEGEHSTQFANALSLANDAAPTL